MTKKQIVVRITWYDCDELEEQGFKYQVHKITPDKITKLLRQKYKDKYIFVKNIDDE